MTLRCRQILLSIALFFAPFQAFAEQSVTVFAAASLQTALNDIAEDYPGKLVLSYGGSGQIARQVAQGAPADVVMLAHSDWMNWLDDGGHLSPASIRNFASNSLVLAGKTGSEPIEQIDDAALLSRLDGGRLAIGNTLGVPAGIYGRQWLENAGFWGAVSSHLAETENVRAALALVARGEAPLGIVYRSDVIAEPGVVTLYDIPGDLHDPVLYPIAIIKGRNTSQATDFVSFILSPTAQEIFVSNGFAPVDQP